mgnify:CR=1 FL=1
MGIRMKIAMGWGMTGRRFRQITRCGEDIDGFLRSRLDMDKDIVVPESWPEQPTMIFTRFLLKADLMDGQDSIKRMPSDLFTTVYQLPDPEQNVEEGTNLVIFYPNCNMAERWQRFNDDLDLTLHYLEDRDQGRDPELRDYIRFLDLNPYPWSASLMDQNGMPLRLDKPLWMKDPDQLPAVPTEIIWYLSEFGVMEREHSLCLRPVIAKWWS